MSGLKATVLEIQRMSTEDGPGIRTTVFLKGCSLTCAWCHNPESIPRQPQVVWHDYRCIGCRTCVQECPSEAIELDTDGARVDRERCTDCGTCVEACPTVARELLGQSWTLEALLTEVLKDRAYYESSGGGITVSGGEPGLQPDLVEALLASCRAEGLHTAIDTCGLVGAGALSRLVAVSDLVLYDLKALDPVLHERLTGQSNERILQNAVAVAEQLRSTGGEMWVRTPLIPQATARDDNLCGIGQFIAENLGDVVKRWELCSFNNLCTDKYRRLGLEWPFASLPLFTPEDQQHFGDIARSSGVEPAIVAVTGPTRATRPAPTSGERT